MPGSWIPKFLINTVAWVDGDARDKDEQRDMDWQNQYCENGYITKTKLHVQCNPHQNPNDIHHRDLKICPKFHLEAQKNTNSQGNTEQKD
jgi:hypothetical protein